ncbi:MAG: acyl-CoA dehydratase activase-related protein [Veillonellales bacterium]
MLITFPHMGDMSIVLKTLFNGLGRQVSVPPPISKRTLELGMKYSPETVCLPFKVNVGNFIEALEQGADTIVTCGGVGPCRLGYYAEIQRSILQDLGFRFDMIVIEPAITNILKNLHRVAPKQSLPNIYSAFRLATAKMNALDRLQQKVYRLQPREINPGEADSVRLQGVRAIDTAETLTALAAVRQETESKLDSVKLRSGIQPLRIGIVGEIYVMLEPFMNQDLASHLGNMGVEVHQTMFLSDYVNGHLFRKQEYQKLFQHLAALAQPYLRHTIGGHSLKSIGHTVNMGRKNFDGVIHIFPFTCMPEVVAKNILPKVSSDANIPVLSLTFDEQSGEAGLMTRLEAFVDLLKYRRSSQTAADPD